MNIAQEPYTPELTLAEKRANERRTIYGFLLRDPENAYWQARLRELQLRELRYVLEGSDNTMAAQLREAGFGADGRL